jgi:Fe-S oxidoreductase
VGSYDPRGNESAKALGEILLKSGISYGVLGSDEDCDGNEVNILGERGLFHMLEEKNIRKFKKLNVKKIVALSPHAYNVIKNEYREKFEVMHYTQFLQKIIKNGKLDISNGLKARVTYHDPCFLGRYNGEYDAPREILLNIPGIKLIEMERNRENSFCCGGGGANFYTNLLGGGEKSPNRIRIREAYNTGADILAVTCPTCMMMLEDAAKDEGLEEKLAIKDISEIIKEFCLKRN